MITSDANAELVTNLNPTETGFVEDLAPVKAPPLSTYILNPCPALGVRRGLLLFLLLRLLESRALLEGQVLFVCVGAWVGVGVGGVDGLAACGLAARVCVSDASRRDALL